MLRLRILRNLKESSSSSEIIFCLPILCAHDAIDDKVGATIEDKSKVLESGQGEHPAEDCKDFDEYDEEDDEEEGEKR